MTNSYKLNNFYLKNHLDKIEILSFDYPEFFNQKLKTLEIKLNSNKNINSVINWNEINGSYSFYFDYDGCEVEIRKWLEKSELATCKHLIIELGYDLPILKVDCKAFINNWYDFYAASGYIGITVICEDGLNYMEFTDENKLLYSNFKIK